MEKCAAYIESISNETGEQCAIYLFIYSFIFACSETLLPNVQNEEKKAFKTTK
jgi:hypothetical protein